MDNGGLPFKGGALGTSLFQHVSMTLDLPKKPVSSFAFCIALDAFLERHSYFPMFSENPGAFKRGEQFPVERNAAPTLSQND